MFRKVAIKARPGGPAAQTSAQPGRAGDQSQADLSAVGAALICSSVDAAWKCFSKCRCTRPTQPSAALLAFRQNRRLQPLTQPSRQLIDLVVSINLDCLLRGPHGDQTMLASLEMGLQFGDQAGRYLVVTKITELRQKL